MQDVQTILPLGSIVRERYVVEDWLGKGGFGAVYLVRDLRVKHNLFALKEVIDADKKERNRFLFEAELLKRLDHHALARVYRVFDDEMQNRAYMLMDYIEGPNLEILRQQQPSKRFSFSQALTVMAPIMEAVDYLHSQHPPIMHRDIKPANIIVPGTGDGTVLVDFGVAKEYDPDSTTTAVRRCSPGYAAPEQYGKGSTIRTDIYELGATLYTLLTGSVPTDALHRMAQIGEGGDDPLEPLNEVVPSIPQHIARAIHRAMSLKSNERFPTVEEFWQALNARPTWRQLGQAQGTAPTGRVLPSLAPLPLVSEQSPSPLVQVVSPVKSTSDDQRAEKPSGKGTLAPVVARVHTSAGISRSKKLLVLALFLLAVLIGFGLETGLWSYLINLRTNHPVAAVSQPSSTIVPPPTIGSTAQSNRVSPTAHPTRMPTPRPTMVGTVKRVPTTPPVVVATHQPTVVPTARPIPTPTRVPPTPTPVPPTPTPTPVSYPNVAANYNGSIDDTTENITTSMALSIQQKAGQGSISGNFTVGPALLGSGPFTGNVTTTKYIQFTVQGYQGNAPLFFYGQVHSDGSMSGSYCSINAQKQCDARAGDAGTWNVARSSSAQASLSSGTNSLQNAYGGWSNVAGVALWVGAIIFLSLCLLLLVLYRFLVKGHSERKTIP